MIRVLLDEDVPLRLRAHFPEDAEVETVQYRGWKGLKNGKLLSAAEAAFDVLVTMDKNLPYQQNIDRYDIAVIILRPRSKLMSDLLSLMPEVQRILPEARAGSVTQVAPPGP